MSRRPTGKKAALIAGVGVVCLAVLSWPTLRVQYQVLRLKREPGYFLEILDRPEDSTEGKAIRAFLGYRSGKKALFREYERLVLEPVLAEFVGLAETVLEAIIWSGDDRGASFVEWFPERHLQTFGVRLKAELLERAPRILSLIGALEGEELRADRYPGLRFEFMRAGRALEMCPRLKIGRILPPDPAYVCLVRRDAEAAVTAIVSLLEMTTNLTSMDQCLAALGDLGPKARAAMPAIQKFLESGRGEEWVWATAYETTRKIAGLPAR